MAVNETEIEEIDTGVVQGERDIRGEQEGNLDENENKQEVAEQRSNRAKGQALTALREDPAYKEFCSVLNEFDGVSLNEDAILEMCLSIQPIDIEHDVDYKLSIDTITQVLAVAKDQVSREPNGVVFNPVTGELDEELSEEQRKQVYSLLDGYENKLNPEQRGKAAERLSDTLIKEFEKVDKKIDFSYIDHTYGNTIKSKIFGIEKYTWEEMSQMTQSYAEKGEIGDIINACRAESILNGSDEVEFMHKYMELQSLMNVYPRDDKAIEKKTAELNSISGAERFRNQDGSINGTAVGEYIDTYATKENMKTIREFLAQDNKEAFLESMDADEKRELLEAIYQVDIETGDESARCAMIFLGGKNGSDAIRTAYMEGDREKLNEIFCNLYNSTLDGDHNLNILEIKERILVEKKTEVVLGHVEHLHSKVLDGTFHDIAISDDLDEKGRDKAIKEQIKQMKKMTKPKLELKREDVSRLITDLEKTIAGKDVTIEELIPTLYTACDTSLKRPIGNDKTRKEVEKAREMLKEVMMADKGKYGQYIDKDEINTSKIRHSVKRLEIAKKISPELSEKSGRGKYGAHVSIVHTPAMEALLQRAEIQVIREEKPFSIANLRSSARDIATAVKEFAQEKNRARKERKPIRAFLKQMRDNLTGNELKSLPEAERERQEGIAEADTNTYLRQIGQEEKLQNPLSFDESIRVDVGTQERVDAVGREQANAQSEAAKAAAEREEKITEMALMIQRVDGTSMDDARRKATELYDSKNRKQVEENQSTQETPDKPTVGGDGPEL